MKLISNNKFNKRIFNLRYFLNKREINSNHNLFKKVINYLKRK